MGDGKMGSVALKLYHGLTEVGEDKQKARVLAEAFEELESRYPEVKDLATGAQLTEKSLLLQKEIVEVDARLQKEMKEIESNLQKEMKEIESNLQKEMKEIESNLQKEISKVDVRIKELEVRLVEKMGRQTWLYLGGLSVVCTVMVTVLKFL